VGGVGEGSQAAGGVGEGSQAEVEEGQEGKKEGKYSWALHKDAFCSLFLKYLFRVTHV
jgi:hypothetical protein